MSQLESFITKYGRVVSDMTVSINIAVSVQPEPYQTLKAERFVSCKLVGEHIGLAKEIADNMEAVVMEDLSRQLRDAHGHFFPDRG